MKQTLSILFLLTGFVSFSQKDSLENLLAKETNDTSKVIHLNKLGGQFVNQDISKAIHFTDEAYRLSVKLNYKMGRAKALGNYGMIWSEKGDLGEAQLWYERSLQLRDSIGDILGAGKMYNNIGNLWSRRDQLPKALAAYQKADAIFEPRDSSLHAVLLRNIGSAYSTMKNFNDAMINFNKALRISGALKNDYEIACVTKEIAIVAYYRNQWDSSLYYHKKALALLEEMDDVAGMCNSYNSIGLILMQKGVQKEAVVYWKKSLELLKQIENKEHEITALTGLAESYNRMGEPGTGKPFAEKALKLSFELGSYSIRSQCYLTLARIAFTEHDYKAAYLYSDLVGALKDSIAGDQVQRVMGEMKTKYDTEKKEKENQILLTQKKLDAQTIHEQKILSYFIITGLALFIALAFFIYRNYRLKQKANIELTKKNELIELQKELVTHQKELIEEKQKEVMDSLRYAKRIQTSLLPTEKFIDRVLSKKKNI